MASRTKKNRREDQSDGTKSSSVADEELYVGIEDPIKLRRALLEGTKGLIQVLQNNERLRIKRQERAELTSQLKDTITELYQLLAHVKGEMPRIPLSHLPKRSTVKKTEEKPKIDLSVKKPMADALSTHDLARELDEIEKKLSDLK